MKSSVGLAALLLAGCTVQNIRPDVALAHDEGVLVTHVHCDTGVNWFEIHPSGANSKRMLGQAATVICPPFSDVHHALRTVRLKQGRYFVGKVGEESYLVYEEAKAVRFEVTPGKLNYIGDLHVRTTWARAAKTVGVGLFVVDAETQARADVASQFPVLMERMPWEKRLAEDLSP